MPKAPTIVTRYSESKRISTKIDPLDDVLNLVDSLTSREYLTDILRVGHGMSATDANARTKLIVPHIEAAVQLIHQSENGPQNVSFLPLYYALLNFAKACILVGPHHNDLPRNRWHGATYPGSSKDSHSLFTENIVIKTGGAIPLFYRTLTGKAFTTERTLKMKDIYPFILDVCAEYEIVVGQPSKFVLMNFSFVDNPNGTTTPRAIVHLEPYKATPNAGDLRVLVGYKKDSANPLQFVGPSFRTGDTSAFRRNLRPFLLYDEDEFTATPVSSKQLLLPEEFPVLLMFFHLSNVVRYKPEFLARVRDSRYWPILSSARRHSILKSLLRFWSFISNRGLFINQI